MATNDGAEAMIECFMWMVDVPSIMILYKCETHIKGRKGILINSLAQFI